MKTLLFELSLITRAKDWRFSFVPFIIGCFYLWVFLFKIEFNLASLRLMLLLTVTTIGFASLGYFINDFFDKEADRLANKKNQLASLKPVALIALLTTIVSACFLPWLLLPYNYISWALIVAEVVLFLLYSLPFPRFKNIPYLSGFIDSAYAYVIPLLLIFHTCSLFMQQAFQPFIIFFSIGVFFIGFRNITIHHLNDMSFDRLSGIKTLPIITGVERTNLLIISLLLLEILFILTSSVLIARIDPFFYSWMLFYILFLVIKIYIRNSVFKKTNNNLEGLRHLTDVAYQVWLPLITLFLAIKTDGRWILILPFHILFLLPSYLHEKMTDGIRFIYGKLLVYVFIPGRHYSSRVINYTIYYFFLLFGVNLKKENKSAMKYLKSRLEKQ